MTPLIFFTSLVTISAAIFAGYQLSLLIDNYLKEQKTIALKKQKNEIIKTYQDAIVDLDKAIEILSTETNIVEVIANTPANERMQIKNSIDKAFLLSIKMKKAYDNHTAIYEATGMKLVG